MATAVSLKHRLIDAGLRGLAALGLDRVLAPLTRGRGAILMLHRVRPFTQRAFAPNRGLEVTPGFLDTVLTAVRAAGYRTVPLGEVPARLAARATERFVAVTFDDGYRDTLEQALPVLERHDTPCTIFVTTGFAERTARLWWLELEERLRNAESLRTMVASRPLTLPAGTPAAKSASFARLAALLMRQPAEEAAHMVDSLGADPARGRELVAALCLDRAGVAALARHPLVTIGGHSATHACLSALEEGQLAWELAHSRARLEALIGRPVTQLAYPYGSAEAAGPREFAAAAAAGYAVAVTTRPGVLHAGHTGRLTGLPRLSVNGYLQSRQAFVSLLSGVPLALWNRSRLA